MAGNSTTRQLPSSIVGRQRERQHLCALLERALGSHGGFVLVSGEAGIGKSTLVDELSRIAVERGALVLAGGCYDLVATPPYGPWVEIVRAYAEDEDLPPLPDELRSGGSLSGIDGQAALFDLVGRFLADVAFTRPLLLVLEDIHWADSASLDLLRYLSRSMAEYPILLVVTYREDEITGDHSLFTVLPALVRESQVIRLELQRLKHDDVRRLVEVRYHLPPADERRLVSYLVRLAEGNPFFTTELLHTLEEREILSPITDGWSLGDLTVSGVPSLIQQVIGRRLLPLDASTRIMLDCAAVAGYEISLDLLRSLHRDASGDLDDAIQQARDRSLLILQPSKRSVRFNHALVRQAVYDAIPPLRRQSLHRAIAESLADRSHPDVDAVANHFYLAGDERALEWLARAAAQAQSLFASDAVVTRCHQAIELGWQLDVDPPANIYRLRGLALDTLGDFDGARSSLETARERGCTQKDRWTEWKSLLDLAELWASRDYNRAGDYCHQAVEFARSLDDPSALGHSLNRLGNWHANATQSADGFRFHDEAREIFESLNDLEGLASTLDLIAMGYLIAGDSATALRYYEQAIPLLREIDDRKTLSTALTCAASTVVGPVRVRSIPRFSLVLDADPDELLAEAIEISRSIEWPAGEGFALCFQSGRDVDRGELRRGFQLLKQYWEIAENIEHRQWLCIAEQSYGQAFADLMLPDRSRLHLERSLKLAEMTSSTFQITQAAGYLASTCVRGGQLDDADRLLNNRVHIGRSPDSLADRACWYAFAELTLARGNPSLALETIDGLIQAIAVSPGYFSPDAGRLRGAILLALRRFEEAEAQLVEARETAEILGLRLFLWRIHATLRKLYLTQGRLDEADGAGSAARAIIDDLACQLDDEDLRTAFLGNARAEVPGNPPYRISGPMAAFGGLTARETEVLQLVARGMTNEQVSEQLFISAHTVSQHLRSIYSKLNVPNRTAASRVAADHGLV